MVHWEEIKLLLLKKFRSSRVGSLHEQFLAIHQEDSIGDYNRMFIVQLAPLDNVLDEVALSTFINGLKPEMRTELRVFEPTTWNRAMNLANRIKEKLQAAAQARGLNPPRTWMNTKSTMSNSGSTKIEQTFYNGGSTTKPLGEIRRMTNSEMQAKREKGLCYSCDNKWSPGHQCWKKELSILVTFDDILTKDEEEGEPTGQVVKLHWRWWKLQVTLKFP